MTSQGEKNRHTAYSLASIRRQMVEAVGDPKITIDLYEDGSQVFEIEHPMFRSPETEAALREVQNDDNAGDHELAQVVLGDRYDAFIEAGGSDQALGHLLILIGRDSQDRLQNGTPTRR